MRAGVSKGKAATSHTNGCFLQRFTTQAVITTAVSVDKQGACQEQNAALLNSEEQRSEQVGANMPALC